MSPERPRASRLSICMAVAGILLLAIPVCLELVLKVGKFDVSESSGGPGVLIAYLWMYSFFYGAAMLGLPLTLLSFVPRRRAWRLATVALSAYAAYACWLSVRAIGVLDTVLCGSLGVAALGLLSLLFAAFLRLAGRRATATTLWLKWSGIVCAAASLVAGSLILFFAVY